MALSLIELKRQEQAHGTVSVSRPAGRPDAQASGPKRRWKSVIDALVHWTVENREVGQYVYVDTFLEEGVVADGWPLRRCDVAMGLKYLCGSWKAIAKVGPGEYRVTELHRYFEPLPRGNSRLVRW